MYSTLMENQTYLIMAVVGLPAAAGIVTKLVLTIKNRIITN